MTPSYYGWQSQTVGNNILKIGNESTPFTLTVIVVDRTAPIIELVGIDVINLARWEDYSDAGYTVSDNYNDSVDLTVEMVGDWVDADGEGLYYVQYKTTDPSGNVSFSIKRFIDVRGTNSIDPINAAGIRAYPNPNNGQLIIQSETVMSAGTQIIIHDALGKEVHRQSITTASKEANITTNGLKPGMYLVYIQDGNHPKTFKIQITQ